MGNLNEDESYVFEPAIIKLTPFDRRLRELRDLQEKREALLTKRDNQRQLATLDYKIQEAQKRFDKEKKRSTDDAWRQRRNTDAWRAGDGREIRNASRRKVRSKPNEDLSHLTANQKDERKRDQRADLNFEKRQAAKGVSETAIQAALALRRQKRACERSASAEAENSMLGVPTFGMF